MATTHGSTTTSERQRLVIAPPGEHAPIDAPRNKYTMVLTAEQSTTHDVALLRSTITGFTIRVAWLYRGLCLRPIKIYEGKQIPMLLHLRFTAMYKEVMESPSIAILRLRDVDMQQHPPTAHNPEGYRALFRARYVSRVAKDIPPKDQHHMYDQVLQQVVESATRAQEEVRRDLVNKKYVVHTYL